MTPSWLVTGNLPFHYQPEGGATVGLLEHASANNWEMFTCLDSLRDVEGTVDLVLDQRATGLYAE